MKVFSYLLTVVSSIAIWGVSLYLTVLLGGLIFCWQCGAEEKATWLFWPLVYLLSFGGAYFFSKLPAKFGGKKFVVAAIIMLALGVVFHIASW